MASESLSQNEIDLLFSGGEGAAPEPVQGRKDPLRDVQVYDFRRPARISKDRKRSLMAMYGLLAKSTESWLTGRVRDQVELDLQSVEQLTFGEFMLALPSPCASYVFDVRETGQQGVIDFGHDLAFLLVDRLLGGVGRTVAPDRALTAMERLVVGLVADRVAFQLGDAWKDYVKLDLEVTGFESIPEMLQAANREDPVLVANIGVRTEDVTSLLLLCLPFASLERFFTGTSSRRQQPSQGSPEERTRDRRALEASLADARIPIGVRLPAIRLPLKRLVGLRPGSVLETGLPPQAPVEVYVAGQRRFTGSVGRMGASLAVRIADADPPAPAARDVGMPAR